MIVKMEHIKKSFGENTILSDISLNVHRGENIVVLGKSGCGKSVLIKCLVGLITPDEGTIHLFDKDMSYLKSRELNIIRKKVGFLFQSAALYDSMSVRENLEFPLRSSALTSKEKTMLSAEVLEQVGLADAIDKMPSELSGGMRKRVGLARALILKPEIILYDEPTTGLDPITSKEISYLILEIQKRYNTASIIITHDIECAKVTANRIVVLKQGFIVAEGSLREVSESKDAWVRSFFE